MDNQEYYSQMQDYRTPAIKFIEMNPSAIICTSDGTEQYGRNEDPDIF